MDYREIAGRLTGFSTPVFGLSWEPPVVDREVAERLIAFLEDKRVLYDPYQFEVPQWSIAAVLAIRERVTELLAGGGIPDELVDHLRAIRAACRRFLRSIPHGPDGELVIPDRDIFDWSFHQALGELRGEVGPHVAQVAVKYGIDVEDDLARSLPLVDADE
jgi:hypothetical protein